MKTLYVVILLIAVLAVGCVAPAIPTVLNEEYIGVAEVSYSLRYVDRRNSNPWMEVTVYNSTTKPPALVWRHQPDPYRNPLYFTSGKHIAMPSTTKFDFILPKTARIGWCGVFQANAYDGAKPKPVAMTGIVY